MEQKKIRTRYAPSPTGFMHIGNLRTALYEFLIAKGSSDGKFILRIEDTDQNRKVEDSIAIIYKTLQQVGIHNDEGPDIGGEFGPYIQSQRLDSYLPLAEQLIKEGQAYYCFCSKERLQSLHEKLENGNLVGRYDGKCRNLSQEEINHNLKMGIPYVIRQKMPTVGISEFCDSVYGPITVANDELEDQILIKTDKFPTYNFANVVDDHQMQITHVVRGCEYLSSTPKYNLLYEVYGWEKPQYIHLPLIMGKNPDGSISKLSKRHGATSFQDLIEQGFLPEAIINYIALLGWCPKDTREIFSLSELITHFSVDCISKSPAIFDYDKLTWFNAEYLKAKSDEEFLALCMPHFKQIFGDKDIDKPTLIAILKPRVTKLTQIKDLLDFLVNLKEYDISLFENKKSKSTLETSLKMLKNTLNELELLTNWSLQEIKCCLTSLAEKLGVKNGTLLWPIRIAISGQSVTAGGAIEILTILGQNESLKRIKLGLEKLQKHQ
jgi:glutamyl-tRNA synthetase